jgi:hypothetical protein
MKSDEFPYMMPVEDSWVIKISRFLLGTCTRRLFIARNQYGLRLEITAVIMADMVIIVDLHKGSMTDAIIKELLGSKRGIKPRFFISKKYLDKQIPWVYNTKS